MQLLPWRDGRHYGCTSVELFAAWLFSNRRVKGRATGVNYHMKNRNLYKDCSPAVVAGLCSHGLAICRALSRRGIPLIALESNTTLPGFATSSAEVVRVPEVNGELLIDSLIETGGRLAGGKKPVLFLTNDNMVDLIGRRWSELSGLYILSWSSSRENVTRLLDKRFCEEFLRDRNYPLPGTWLVDRARPGTELPGDIPFPAVVKPSRPLGEFKALRVENREALLELLAKHPNTPVVIQEWIPGGDEQIYFCATVARRGKPLCFFDGTKYLSHPPARGQTVAAGPGAKTELRGLLTRLVEDAQLDGPVSLEAKLDPEGRFRIIEPTVGRTDFWAKLAIVNGVDLSWIEYRSVTAKEHNFVEPATQVPRVWFDSEKDPFSYIRLAVTISRDLKRPWLPSFSYLDLRDLKPYWRALSILQNRIRQYVRRRL